MSATHADAIHAAPKPRDAPKPREMMYLNTRSDARGAAQRRDPPLAHPRLRRPDLPLPVVLLPVAMLLMGIVQAALFATLHETGHYTAFKSRRANAIVGWIATLPSTNNWHFYQQFHLAHHKHTQDPANDPELSPPPPGDFGTYLARMSGLTYWRARMRLWSDAWRGDLSRYGFLHEAMHPRIIASIRASSALTVALALAAAVAFGPLAVFLYWLGPQFLGQPILRLYLLTEHTGCTEDANGLTNTRTMLTNPAVRLLMWNMPFHAEHHLYPFIPFHRLGEAHAVLREKLAHIGPGYAAWHRDHVRELRAQKG
jgi:fatty acid desaturase